MKKFRIVCPCLFGVESVLSGEIKRMGGEDVSTQDGRVSFIGDAKMIAKANINLRTAERVLLELGSFNAYTFTDLFDNTYAIDFGEFIPRDAAFPVKGWSLNSKLFSVPDCQAIIKKAAVRSMSRKYGNEWFKESGTVYQISFSIMKDKVSVFLDTTGVSLHKRGYRTEANDAPIKETLAAGIIDLARVKQDSVVIDPFCGSGTLLIEAGLKALRVPSGLRRRFASEQWDLLTAEEWQQARTEASAGMLKEGKFRGYGSDIDPEAIILTGANAKRATISSRIQAAKKGIADFKLPDIPFILITNPPYGERLLDKEKAEELYKIMGEKFLPGEGRSYYIISPHEDFEKLFGRKANKRRKLYNGNIKCQLFMYF